MADKPAPAPAADAPKKRDPKLDAVIRHHFWILSVAVIATSITVWYLGKKALDQQFLTDSSTNESAFSSLVQIKRPLMAVNQLPNADYAKQVGARREVLIGQVFEAWQKLYDRQSSVLKVDSRIPDLGELVLLDVGERAERFKNDQRITDQLNFFHNNGILDKEFNDLFAMINLRRPRSAAAAPAPGAAGAAAPVAAPVAAVADEGANQPAFDGVLVWNSQTTTQQLVSRYQTRLAPSVDRMAITYEDIWLFRSMFGVIQTINSRPIDEWLTVMDGGEAPVPPGPVDQANVPIKRIEYCDVAQRAAGSALGSPGVIEDFNPQVKLGWAQDGRGGGDFQVGTEGTATEDQKLLKDRYLTGRDEMVEDPSQPPVAEFRQVFVQMTVLMDQRVVPALIAECANAPLPIESRQIRMDLKEVDVRREANAQEAANQMNKIERSPHDVTVTIRGMVYIYVKPDKEKLGKGTDPEPGKRSYGIPVRRQEAQ